MASPANAGKQLPGEVLTRAQVNQLLQATGRGACGARDRALIALLYRGGLRVSEALSLRPADLDSKAGTVRIERGKGGKPRTIGLDPGAFAMLERWLGARRDHGLTGHRPLFSTLKGHRLDPSHVRRSLKRLARRAGIQKRVHPHGLRHTHAVEHVREGTPLPELQAQLGHSSLAVTSRYLAHVTAEDLAARARNRDPWAT